MQGLPVDFCFNANPVSLKFLTHTKIVFQAGTGLCLPILKCMRNTLCVAVTDSAVKARCSPVQFMVSTKLLKILIKSPVQLMVSTEKGKKQNGIICTFQKYKHFIVYLLYLPFI